MQHPQPKLAAHCRVLDTLSLAREIHPGQRNSLDALCKRYEVDASKRDVHGALIDSELLARVYLAMTGGQSSLLLDEEEGGSRNVGAASAANQIGPDGPGAGGLTADTRVPTIVIEPTPEELAAHDALLEKIRESGACVWDFD
jgi:DNA polymerase-3 subunit epsilon